VLHGQISISAILVVVVFGGVLLTMFTRQSDGSFPQNGNKFPQLFKGWRSLVQKLTSVIDILGRKRYTAIFDMKNHVENSYIIRYST
jgi:hypothetical protein